MGVDVGNARVGTSLSDPDGILATPLKTLRRDSKKNSDRRVLRKLVEVNDVKEIFVGLPKTMRGGESDSTRMARDYAHALRSELDAEGNTHINIWLVDERLTTVSAHRSSTRLVYPAEISRLWLTRLLLLTYCSTVWMLLKLGKLSLDIWCMNHLAKIPICKRL